MRVRTDHSYIVLRKTTKSSVNTGKRGGEFKSTSHEMMLYNRYCMTLDSIISVLNLRASLRLCVHFFVMPYYKVSVDSRVEIILGEDIMEGRERRRGLENRSTVGVPRNKKERERDMYVCVCVHLRAACVCVARDG